MFLSSFQTNELGVRRQGCKANSEDESFRSSSRPTTTPGIRLKSTSKGGTTKPCFADKSHSQIPHNSQKFLSLGRGFAVLSRTARRNCSWNGISVLAYLGKEGPQPGVSGKSPKMCCRGHGSFPPRKTCRTNASQILKTNISASQGYMSPANRSALLHVGATSGDKF